MFFVVLLNVLGLANVVVATLLYLGVSISTVSGLGPFGIGLSGIVMLLLAQLLRAFIRRKSRQQI